MINIYVIKNILYTFVVLYGFFNIILNLLI